MSDQDLARAVRRLVAAEYCAVPDSRQVVEDVMHRRQWRVRLLAGLSILFWLLAVAGLVLLLIGLDRFVVYVRIADFHGAHAKDGPREFNMSQMLHGTSLLHHSIPLIGGSLLALLLAALCTILLILTSRRATLHQIQLSLMSLNEQLKELRQATALSSEADPSSTHISSP